MKIISRNNFLLVIAKNDVEMTKLSQIKSISSVAANAHVAAKPKYCIIGVPVVVDDETIKLGTGCESATRVVKKSAEARWLLLRSSLAFCFPEQGPR